MKARIDAARAICFLTAANADLAAAAPTEEERHAAKLREEVLTPIAKAWSTDLGVEIASLGVQIHGGMGFIEETGAAQHYRDARIAPIYEGANGIQAMDLAGRKLGMEGGAGVQALLVDIRATAELCSRVAPLAGIAERLAAAADAAAQATDWLSSRRGEPNGLAGATAYLKLMGEVTGGWLLAKGALAAANGKAPDAAYGQARIDLASHFAETVLAQAPGQVAGITIGAETLSRLDAAALGG